VTFRFSSCETIRSANQRALVSRWMELAQGRSFPAITEFQGIGDLQDPKEIVIWNVEGTGRLQKFRAVYQGEHISEAFNESWAGMTMEMVVPMSLRRSAIEPAKECAASGCPVYTISSTIDGSEQRVDCERLLLPFGRGAKVEQVLSSLHLAVETARRKILKHFTMQTDTLLQVKIRTTNALLAKSAGKSAGKGSDKRRASRRDVRRAARIKFARQNMTCIVRNLSATGAAIEAANLAIIPDTFRIVLEMESSERRCEVKWRRKNRIGIQFK